MKNLRKNKKFLKELQKVISNLKAFKANAPHTLSINANYGHYQILIEPNGDKRSRNSSIEITGEIHHLFLTPGHLAPNPPREQMKQNLKNTVIARGLHLHLLDPVGDGEHLAPQREGNGIEAREFINLAGEEGEKMIQDACNDRRLSLEAYRIVQQDILKALKQRKRSLEYVS